MREDVNIIAVLTKVIMNLIKSTTLAACFTSVPHALKMLAHPQMQAMLLKCPGPIQPQTLTRLVCCTHTCPVKAFIKLIKRSSYLIFTYPLGKLGRLFFSYLCTNTWFKLLRVKSCKNDLKGNKNYFKLAGSSSYRGFKLPRVKLQ